MSDANIDQLKSIKNSRLLSFLDQHQVKMIDEALSALGDYGELRLIVEKGRLRLEISPCTRMKRNLFSTRFFNSLVSELTE